MSIISIVTPVYNSEKYISRCIESILNQSLRDWELILVNDGSKDDSLEVCKGYAKQDNRIQVVSRENGGPSVARNLGISLVTSEYVTFVDSDDWIDKDYLKFLVTPFLKNTDIDLVCCDYVEYSKYNPEGLKINHLPLGLRNKNISNIEYANCVFNGGNGFLWSKAFKTELIKSNQLKLNEKVRLSEDLLFVLEYLKNVKHVFSTTNYSYNYNRLNEDNLSGVLELGHLRYLEITNKEIIRLAPDLSIDSAIITRKRKAEMIRKLSYDILLSKKPISIKRNEFLILSKESESYKIIEHRKLADYLHFFLLKMKCIYLDEFLMRTLQWIAEINRSLKK